jgi:CRISPR system Cascade subunit CasA
MSTEPSTPLFQLLDEPLLGIEDAVGDQVWVSLPELLARLSRGEAAEATALQAHQQHAWHSFLVQLAALALARSGEGEQVCSPRDGAAWRALLVASAAADGAGEEAFALVVPDLTKSAFLQPGLSGGSLADLERVYQTPSQKVDVLVTAKNHDVKMNRLTAPRLEHWIFSLVTLQTMQGGFGRGGYGITRMNSGYGSRPCVAFAPSMREADRFRRDVDRLLAAREGMLAEVPPSVRKAGLTGLVWCKPWDGTAMLSIERLDPFFIEICRRIRLTGDSRTPLTAHCGLSAGMRIDGKALNGITGDAWTPVSNKRAASLTVPETGFVYDRVSDLFDGDWRHGAAGVLVEADGEEPLWLGQVLVRGQGKTGGYHERWIPIPPAARGYFLSDEGRAQLGQRAQDWTKMAGEARLRVLKPALLSLMQGGADKLDFEDGRVNPLLDGFDAEIDRHFFTELFSHVDADDNAARVHWHTWLRDRAEAAFEQAIDAVPVSAARRLRAIAMGERQLFFGARRYLPEAEPRQGRGAVASPEKEEAS